MPVSFAVLAAAVLGFVAPSVWRHPNLKKSCPLILLIHFLFVGQNSQQVEFGFLAFALHCLMMQFDAMQCNAANATRCNAMQYDAMLHNTLDPRILMLLTLPHGPPANLVYDV
jgi:hypothetical protein